jgi:hypothetical protein
MRVLDADAVRRAVEGQSSWGTGKLLDFEVGLRCLQCCLHLQ